LGGKHNKRLGGFVTSLTLLTGDGKQAQDEFYLGALTCQKSKIPPWR